MKNRTLKNVLVTGGSGFIGSNFIHYLFGMSTSGNKNFTDAAFDGKVINIDNLTYAGNPENLSNIESTFGKGCPQERRRYFFEKGDICDSSFVTSVLKKYDIDTIVHFAAESHVDRSILGPEAFIKTNVIGTYSLLESARNFWKQEDSTFKEGVIFHHISTDEVYGSLGKTGYFTETTPYDPRSPYSASKASSDHLVMSYFHTYGLPVTLSNCTNNYGPYQFPEKLIPLMILNMAKGENLPVYGDGKNIRDWIYVEDHNRGVLQILRHGKIGEKYNIGGENEWENIKLLEKLIELVAESLKKDEQTIRKTITFVKDRPGHDKRYAIDCSKIKKELGWERKMTFEEGLRATVNWNLNNNQWIQNILSGSYKNWVEKNYNQR